MVCFISHSKILYTCRQTEFEQKLEKVQKELELLKEQRNQQKHVADSAMRQRDMYRILLQTAGVDLPPQGELTAVKTYKSTRCMYLFEQNGCFGLSGSVGGSESITTPIKPVVTPTRSTTSQSVASEVAQAIQTKVAFKQVSPTKLHTTCLRTIPNIIFLIKAWTHSLILLVYPDLVTNKSALLI